MPPELVGIIVGVVFAGSFIGGFHYGHQKRLWEFKQRVADSMARENQEEQEERVKSKIAEGMAMVNRANREKYEPQHPMGDIPPTPQELEAIEQEKQWDREMRLARATGSVTLTPE